jgi:predicted nucleotide-binding protein
MARRSSTPPAPRPANLTVDDMNRGIARLQKRIEEVERFNPQTVTDQYNAPELDALTAAVAEALALTFGHGTLDYNRYKDAAEFDRGPYNYAHVVPPHEFQRSISGSKERSLALLRQAIRSLEERLSEAPAETIIEGAPRQERGPLTRKVFIVHGHDEGSREMVARFLQAIGFRPIILHEQANQGRTVIEKVEDHGDVAFAVVLLTADDEGCPKGGTPVPRARQNVILELGYFVGRLGRKHVCALKRGDLEIPSDFGGVVYEPFNESGGWKQALGRELEAAGFDIDWNKVMRG